MLITKNTSRVERYPSGGGVPCTPPAFGRDAARADSSAANGGRSGEAFCGYLAPAWRGSRISSPLSRKVRISTFHSSRNPWSHCGGAWCSSAAWTCMKPWRLRRNPEVIMRVGPYCCPGRCRRNSVSPYLGVTIDQLIAKSTDRTRFVIPSTRH